MAELESVFEKRLIDQLCRDESQWNYRPDLNTEEKLWANFKKILEQNNKAKLNDTPLSDAEFAKIKNDVSHASFYDAAKWLVGESGKVYVHVQRGNEQLHLVVLNNEHIAGGTSVYEVINQYQSFKHEDLDGDRDRRFDVTLLINGIPMIHIELKNKEHSYMEGYRQIKKYIAEGKFHGLFSNVQMFVVSNAVDTKYFAAARDTELNHKFLSGWLDHENHPVSDYIDFAKQVLKIPEAHEMVTKYVVLDNDKKKLLILRPYQIHAIESIRNASKHGESGFIWHTTGSGKTLTSFKAAQLATRLPYIDKVLFVVDRKDLDYQTMREYDSFQKGAANGNTSTKVLEQQIASAKSKIIITTIQKLTSYIKKNPDSDFYKKEVVMIFDECHRSQFGDMHQLIIKRFKKYYLFGFTGTPIFMENMPTGTGIIKTTEDAFGERLHTYTIVNAISDHNVLPFRVAYIRTLKEKEEVENSKVWDIAREKALSDPRRVTNITKYILDNYYRQTMQSEHYDTSVVTNVEQLAKDKKKQIEEKRDKTKLHGFNSIFAVQNIPMAKQYYLEFLRQMELLPANKRLRIATIFSYGANEEDPEENGDENNDNTDGLDAPSREFLERAIEDYNKMFGTSYDTSADKFPNYYKDVSLRMKNREIDVLLVVNMFLTGFDATTLNTLWVDKNLRFHGLLQSYSRTNRILNAVKQFGNIVCFRNLEDATNKALSLFGDPEARGVSILRPFDDYFNGFDDKNGKHQKGYRELVEELLQSLKPGERPVGMDAKKAFIKLFGNILKMRNLLSVFDQFQAVDMLSERDVQDYTSIYLDLAEEIGKPGTHEKEDITDDIVFEMELIKQVEVNIDFILFLVEQYRKSHKQDGEIRVRITKAIDSSPDLRDKKVLIEKFIENLTPDSEVDAAWRVYINNEKRRQFEAIVEDEKLKRDKAVEFIENAYERGYVPEGGMELDGIMPSINPFDPNANREGKIATVLEKLKAFFNRFADISDGDFTQDGINVNINVHNHYHDKIDTIVNVEQPKE